MSITKFNIRQLPDGLLFAGTIAGPNAWRVDVRFIETPNGSRTFFTLTDAFENGKILVFKNGIKMIQTPDIILHPPTIVEFVVAPLTGAYLEATYLVPLSADVSLWRVDETMLGLKNGVNQIFSTAVPYVSNKIMVYKNGRKLVRGVGLDYIETGTTTVQITPAPSSTDFVETTYFMSV